MLEVAHDDRQKDFRAIGDVLHEEIDKLHRLSIEQTRADRHAVRLQGPRRDHRRLPAGQPDHHRRPPVDGQVARSSRNIAENAALEHGKPVALFSLEMSEAELAQRFVASQARIKGEELRKGRVAEQRWPKILQASPAAVAGAAVRRRLRPTSGVLELRAKARRLHQPERGRARA